MNKDKFAEDINPMLEIFCGIAIASGLSQITNQVLEYAKPNATPPHWYLPITVGIALAIGIANSLMIFVDKSAKIHPALVIIDFICCVLVYALFATAHIFWLYAIFLTAFCSIVIIYPVAEIYVLQKPWIGTVPYDTWKFRVGRALVFLVIAVVWFSPNSDDPSNKKWLWLTLAIIAAFIGWSYVRIFKSIASTYP